MGNKATKVMVGVLIMLGGVSAASAQDGVIRGRVGVSNNDFTSMFSGGELKSKFNSLNVGATYIMNTGVYLDGAIKSSMSAKWGVDGGFRNGEEDAYSRRDITLTVGKALGDGVQIFTGYQQSNSTINLGPNNTPANFEEQFNVKGFFAGAGKTIPMSVGSVNLNAAVGAMKGRLLDGSAEWHSSKVGTGYSLGAVYSYPLSQETTLSAEYKLQAYKYKFDANSPNTAGDDKMQVIGVSVSRQF